ncbi:thioredoxin reductase (NADPH) [Cytobacillus eiseniae]|uniref:Ferredoxin--NADP reductase n=1 Tax=Cytobacillus eiseniae TaxID=762947 RepID=A0ABS4REY1_9BACI|nr:NAD(P)/FAD-dependent oxidoreductase [Cytobacillus eiseniae]MBP2240377.1 thioredoxin reductase (NADPH) [Cytobacillus eiseniae]
MEVFDVTIIGGGPAGLYAAFYSGLREMKVKVIEAQPYFGGKIQLYPDKVIWDVGGQPPTLACKLIDQIIRQGLTFNPSICLNEKITSIEKQDDLFIARSENQIHYSKTIILAIGGGIFSPQRLTVFENHLENIHYTIKSPSLYKNKRLVISGKGASAFDWANALAEIAEKVTVVVSDEKEKITPDVQKRLAENNVQILLQTSIVQAEVDDEERIISLMCENINTNERKQIFVDEVLINLGYDRDFTLLRNCDLPIQTVENSYIDGQPNGTTSVPGLFAIGDIIKHNAKLNMISGAFIDAANTVNKVKQYIDPKASKTAMVSTHNKMFKNRNDEIRKTIR